MPSRLTNPASSVTPLGFENQNTADHLHITMNNGDKGNTPLKQPEFRMFGLNRPSNGQE